MPDLSRRTERARSIFSLSVVLLVTSCHADHDHEPFVGYVSHSRFFEYHDRVDEPLCPTTLALLDRHAQRIGGKIGLSLDESNPFRYYKFRDDADFAAAGSGCPPENGACALGDAVYSTRFFHAHELAHDYVFRAWGGWSTGLVNEGEAVALSCEPSFELQPGQLPRAVLGSPDWRALLYLYGDSAVGYAAAGVFVTYLAERYGWSSIAELHHRIPPGISAADFEQEFAQVYPLSMDQAWAQALGTPGAAACQKDWQCVTSPIHVGEDASPDCDGEMHRSVSVSDSAGLVLALEGQNSELELRSCAAAPSAYYVLEGGQETAQSTHWAHLPPGSYAMISGDGPLLQSVSFRSELPSGVVGDTCASAGSVALDSAGDTYVDLLPGDTATSTPGTDASSRWIHLAGDDGLYSVSLLGLTWNDPLSSGALAVCDDCTEAAACVSLSQVNPVSVRIGKEAVLRMQGVLALPASSRTWGQLVFHSARSATSP